MARLAECTQDRPQAPAKDSAAKRSATRRRIQGLQSAAKPDISFHAAIQPLPHQNQAAAPPPVDPLQSLAERWKQLPAKISLSDLENDPDLAQTQIQLIYDTEIDYAAGLRSARRGRRPATEDCPSAQPGGGRMSTATETPGVNPVPTLQESTRSRLRRKGAIGLTRRMSTGWPLIGTSGSSWFFLFLSGSSPASWWCVSASPSAGSRCLRSGHRRTRGSSGCFLCPWAWAFWWLRWSSWFSPARGAAASTRPRQRSTSTTAISPSERSSGNSSLRRSPSAADSRSVPRILRCKSEPAWPPWSAAASTSRASGCACLRPSALPRAWRLRSTRLSRPFFL